MDIVTTVYTWVSLQPTTVYTWISLQMCTHGYNYNTVQNDVHMDIVATVYTWISLQPCTHGYNYNTVQNDLYNSVHIVIAPTSAMLHCIVSKDTMLHT